MKVSRAIDVTEPLALADASCAMPASATWPRLAEIQSTLFSFVGGQLTTIQPAVSLHLVAHKNRVGAARLPRYPLLQTKLLAIIRRCVEESKKQVSLQQNLPVLVVLLLLLLLVVLVPMFGEKLVSSNSQIVILLL